LKHFTRSSGTLVDKNNSRCYEFVLEQLRVYISFKGAFGNGLNGVKRSKNSVKTENPVMRKVDVFGMPLLSAVLMILMEF
jgi:hypothetical protein